jgi:HD-like signal output (HDOD) protein/FixJ family two-component response regulator
VLFVDDEPRVLQGIKLGLWSYRQEWQTECCTSGADALERLASEPFDAVVTDMRMPGIDGEALLRRVQEAHPDVLRVVLSGQTERKVAARMVHIAHQFLAKPCAATVIGQHLRAAFALRAQFKPTTLRAVVSGLGQLKVSQRTQAELRLALDSAQPALPAITELVMEDSALCLKVLQVTNSAFFGAPRPINSVREAVQALDAESLRAALASPEGSSGQSDSPEQLELQDRARAIAAVAERVARSVHVDPAQAVAAGLLSTLGARVLCTYLPADYALIRRRALDEGLDMQQVELARLGTTHPRVGAFLAGLWGLQPTLVAALCGRKTDSATVPEPIDLGWVLRVACAVVEEASGQGPRYFAPLDPALRRRAESAEWWAAAGSAPRAL